MSPLAVLLIAWGAGARAEAPDARALLEALVPAVERAEGRRFVAVPEVAVASQREVQRMLERKTRDRPGAAPEWMADYDRLLGDEAIAVYSYSDETIYLIDEAISGLEPDMRRWGVAARPVLECVLVHELLHALQHQYAPWVTADGSGRALAALALIEGHAELAALSYCRDEQPEAAGYFSTLSAPLPVRYGPAPEDRATLIYGYGLALARQLQDAGGRGAIWAALQDPPGLALIRAAAAPSPAAGWDDPELLRSLSEALLPAGGWEISDEGPSLTALEPLLTPTADPPPGALAGRAMIARSGLETALLTALMLPTARDAEALVQRRSRALEAARRDPELSLYFLGQPRVRTPWQLKTRRLRALERGGETLRLELPGYREYWATRGSVVLAGFFDGVDISQRDFAELLEGLAAAAATEPPPPRPPDPALGEWIAQMAAAGAADGPRLSWQYRLDQLADRLEAGDLTACTEAAEAAAVGLPEHKRAELDAAVYGCAVLVQSLEGADAALARGGAPIDAAAGHDHALMLRDAGRREEALALLDRIGDSPDPALNRSLRSLRMVLLAELGRLDEAAAMARAREGDPARRAYVASELARSGRTPEAAVLLAECCPLLDGAPRVLCDQLRAELPP